MYIQEFYYKNTILWQSHEILILFQNHKLLSGGSFCSSRYFKAQFCLFFKSLLSQFQTDTSPPKTIWYTVFHYSLSGWVTPFSIEVRNFVIGDKYIKMKVVYSQTHNYFICSKYCNFNLFFFFCPNFDFILKFFKKNQHINPEISSSPILFYCLL